MQGNDVPEVLGEAPSMDDQEKRHYALLKRISAGAVTVTKAEDVALTDELIRSGYVRALESTSFGERHFLDVQIMPSGEERLHRLSARVNPLSK
jgi:hypothetical protein